MPASGPRALLTPFGFTELESRLYCELLKRPNSTGYRLARAVGKATANAYQSLSNLVRKGAVLEDNGDPKRFRAVPPSELFAALRGTFDIQATVAEAAMERLARPANEERLYQVKNVEQALTHALALIGAAE